MLLSLSFKLFWRHRQEQFVMILRFMPNSCSLQFKLTFLTVSRICSEIVLSEIEAQSTRSWIFLKPQFFWCGLEDFSRPSRSVSVPTRICPSTRIRIHSSIQDSSVNIVNKAYTKANYMWILRQIDRFVHCLLLFIVLSSPLSF